MSVEVLPVGYRCNLGCTYCYQNPIRDAGNFGPELDLEAMKAAALAAGAPISIFGGEALLTPLPILEELFAFSVEHFSDYAKRNSTSPTSIQTNGALMTTAHLELFKKYRVGVGFSIDGPGELNLARWAGSLEKTNTATAKSLAAFYRCLESGINPSLIVTLHAGNASESKLDALVAWFEELDRRGLYHAGLHVLEVDDEQIREELELSAGELVAAYQRIAALPTERLRFDVFTDIERLLLGDDGKTTCTWNACDPYSTAAVQGIAPDGTLQNCGRTADAGVTWRKSETTGHERQLALYTTPQESGGCQGCEFWIMCKGQCPGTAIGNDWRNRTEHCFTWKELFRLIQARLESEGRETLASSSRTAERDALETRLFEVWSQGLNFNLATAIAGGEPSAGGVGHGDNPHGDDHGDHGDVGEGADYTVGRPVDAPDDVAHGDVVHGDSRGGGGPHGDSHADHGDEANPIHADRAHGDHADNQRGVHGDVGHSDIPHGDSDTEEHGDAPHHDTGHADGSHGDAPTRANPLVVQVRGSK